MKYDPNNGPGPLSSVLGPLQLLKQSSSVVKHRAQKIISIFQNNFFQTEIEEQKNKKSFSGSDSAMKKKF